MARCTFREWLKGRASVKGILQNLWQLVSISYCILFSIRRARFRVVFGVLLGGLALSLVRLTQRCHLGAGPARPPYEGQSEELTAGALPLPRGLKSSLQSWIFHLSISQNRCQCFCLPGRGRCISISFHPSSSSHVFFNLFPLRLPSWIHIPFCRRSVFLRFLSSQNAQTAWSLTQTSLMIHMSPYVITK